MRLKLHIEQDQDAQSPQSDGDTDLFIVASHPQFTVPVPGEKTVPQYAKEIVDRFKKTHWLFPIEAYIHGNVAIAFSQEGQFPDRRWDVSQVGYVFAAKSEWRLSKSARKAAASFIETWNQYLSGDVWGYVIANKDGETVDSCWGFYGKEYCQKQGEEALAAQIRLAECVES